MPGKTLSDTHNVSRETIERLRLLQALVVKWNKAINLVSNASLSQIWDRHISDSLQLYDLAEQDVRNWFDLGSGGGFPGLVVAAAARGRDSDMNVTLVESDSRKCVFLREAARQMDLKVSILNQRVEDIAPANADVISARALASLSKLCEMAVRHVSDNGLCIFPKGARHSDEVPEARVSWSFDLVTHQSLTDPSASILVLRNLRHV